MHELSLSRAILDTVKRHAGRRRVTQVNVTIGALRQVVPESLEFYFGIVSRDTVCDGAALTHNLVPARARCDGCGREWELTLPNFQCDECGGAGRPVRGEEFEIESIEIVEVEPCEVANAPH
jgi:hydrogenase nickel incorporation protein HypA/HybF